MERIRAAGGRVSFDPNIREEVWRQPEALRPCLQKALLLADVVKLSREELAFISHLDDLENAIRWMMQTYPLRLLLVTLGGDGVYVHDGQRLRHFRAAPVVPVDTTGAGDAFVAGLLAALARLHELPQEAQWPAVIAQERRPAARWPPPPKGP